MGVSLSHATGRTRGGRRTFRPNSDINVTPFVDVMLVLLIVFMVTAPLLTVGVPVDLPQTRAQNIPTKEQPLQVTIDAQGQIYVQKKQVAMEDLVPMLTAIAKAQAQGSAAGTGGGPAETRIFVFGDQALAYGRIMQVMGAITSAGFTRVALISETPKGQAALTPAPATTAPAPRR
ncbi:protein TolR [Inquilinus sp. NPDC058860]|uniref:protein TolR n=1 Tax=Inquilinus sp. NPDC058860 TaxID=3346652 RepID=UPI0036A66C27